MRATFVDANPSLAAVTERLLRPDDMPVAIHRDPDERYASASELVDDLDAILSDHPTSLDGPFPFTRAQLYLRRNRLQVSAAASVAVLLAALGATAVVGARLKDQMREAEGTAVRKTDQMISDAQNKIAQDIADAKKDVEKEMRVLVADLTAKVIGEKLDSKKDAELLDKALREAQR